MLKEQDFSLVIKIILSTEFLRKQTAFLELLGQHLRQETLEKGNHKDGEKEELEEELEEVREVRGVAPVASRPTLLYGKRVSGLTSLMQKRTASKWRC